jgi:hypothetical protein
VKQWKILNDLIDYHVDKMFQFPAAFKQIPKSVNVTARLFCETHKLQLKRRMFFPEQRNENDDYNKVSEINGFLILIYMFRVSRVFFDEKLRRMRHKTKAILGIEQSKC